jgi:hypothetical protein
VLTDSPVQAAPEKPDRQDDERHADEQALAEVLVGRVAPISSDGEHASWKWRGHDRRG